MADYLIDGVEVKGDEAVRNFCLDYTPKGSFKQDFRLVSRATDKRVPAIQLIELLQATGHDVQEVPQKI